MPHWRDHLDSSLLGAYSLFDDATEKFKQIEGYIVRCTHEDHNLGASGRKKCFVAYTSIHQTKPMKINVTISKAIALAAGSQNPDRWVNVPVTFFVDENVKTKDGPTAAIRVKGRTVAPPDYSKQEAQLRACETLEDLKAVFTSTGFPQAALVHVKDEMKTKIESKNELPTNTPA